MAYDDNYIDAVTMQDACPADPGDTPGMNPDCKFIAPGEDITVFNTNRPSLQLAVNCDILKGPLDAQIAIAQVGALLAFSGASITINPTGGAGNISFTGYLYMGNATYAPPSQERYDTLFQILDEDYNEVVVNGNEVKITNTAPIAIGTGWYNAGVVTLTLNESVPAGNYRLAYARNSTLAALPDDALIRADIRGLHEAAAESEFKNTYVCAVSTGEGPVDFLGAGAIDEALAELPGILGGEGFVLRVRTGTYTIPAVFDMDNVSIIGNSKDDVILTVPGADTTISGVNAHFENVSFDMQGNLLVTGNGCQFDNVDYTGPGGVARRVEINSDRCRIYNSVLSLCNIEISEITCNSTIIENVDITAYDRGLYINGAARVYIKNLGIVGGAVYTSPLVEITGGSNGIVADGLVSVCGGGSTHDALSIHNCYRLVFSGSSFVSDAGEALFYGENPAASLVEASFEACTFQSDGECIESATDTAQYAKLLFNNCRFQAYGGSEFLTRFCAFLAKDINDTIRSSGITLDNCFFDDLGDCAGRTAGAELPVIEFQGVTARNIKINRVGGSKFYQNGPYLKMTYSSLDRLEVNLDCSNALDDTFPGDGMIQVLYDSTLRDAFLNNVSHTHSIPILYMLGHYMSNALAIGHKAVTLVDGFAVYHGYATPSETQRLGLDAAATSALFVVENTAHLRGLTISAETKFKLTEPNRFNSLILLKGWGSRLYDSEIWISEVSAKYGVLVEDSAHRIVHNDVYINLLDWDLLNDDMSLIQLGATVECHVNDNQLAIGDMAGSDAKPNRTCVIHAQSGCKEITVKDNHVRVDHCEVDALPGGVRADLVICIEAPGVGNEGCDVACNSLSGDSTSTDVPDISFSDRFAGGVFTVPPGLQAPDSNQYWTR